MLSSEYSQSASVLKMQRSAGAPTASFPCGRLKQRAGPEVTRSSNTGSAIFVSLASLNSKPVKLSREDSPDSLSANGVSLASSSCGAWLEQIASSTPVARPSLSASLSVCVLKGGDA